MTYALHRAASSPQGTFGILSKDGVPLCLTLEAPWQDNAPDVSCIPPGTYHCIPHGGERWTNVWEVTGVPGRSAILIHTGNTIHDTEGCILVGIGLGQLGTVGITSSLATLNMLRATLPQEFDLTIL